MTSSRPKRAITRNPKYAEEPESGDEQEANLTSSCLSSPSMRRAKKPCRKAPGTQLPTEPLNGVDRWGRCVACQSLVELRNEEGARCGCGGVVRFDANSWYDNWVQCSSCARWRSISKASMQEIEEQGEGFAWHCSMMFAGATCRTPARSWSSAVRVMDKQARAAAANFNGTQLLVADEAVTPASCDPVQEPWCVHASGQLLGFEEYVVGRDRLWQAEALAAGLDVSDGQTGEHVLWTTQLPPACLLHLRPFVDTFLLLWQRGLLSVHEDGRVSAGPVDVRKYLAQPIVKAQVDLAMSARQKRLKTAGMPAPKPSELLKYIVHVSPDGRKVYIGEESDRTSRGNSVMDFNKSWKSLPIPSWSGGWKRADMPGERGYAPPRILT